MHHNKISPVQQSKAKQETMNNMRKSRSEPTFRKSASSKMRRSTSTGSMRRATSSSKVRFDEGESTQTFELDTSIYDKNEVWYTPEELKTLRKITLKENLPEEGPCCSSAARPRRNDLVQAILEQQCEHQSLGIRDPKGLRIFSRACTKTSRESAVSAAILTAQEVMAELTSAEEDALQFCADFELGLAEEV